MGIEGVQALTFDVFGTVVDWRSSIIEECRTIGEAHGIATDWESFTDTWRYEGYLGGIEKVNDGELPWMTVDALHRRMLDQLLHEREIALPEDEIEHLNRAWHRLRPWPDAVAGMERLRSRYIVASLSNGNVALLVNMAKSAGLPWDCVLSAEISGAYKELPQCYLRTAELLALAPSQVMMVSSHKRDIRGAQAVGFQVAFIPRPTEAGPNVAVDLTPERGYDLVATDFLDLADKLGA